MYSLLLIHIYRYTERFVAPTLKREILDTQLKVHTEIMESIHTVHTQQDEVEEEIEESKPVHFHLSKKLQLNLFTHTINYFFDKTEKTSEID